MVSSPHEEKADPRKPVKTLLSKLDLGKLEKEVRECAAAQDVDAENDPCSLFETSCEMRYCSVLYQFTT